MIPPTKNQIVERRSSETSEDWQPIGRVTEVDGNICHYYDGRKTDTFIWQHPEGLNTLHRWKPNPPVEHATS
jgi:hypothetical protein